MLLPLSWPSFPKPAKPDPVAWTVAGRAFLTAFVSVFVAEVGDKTQLAVLLMAAEAGDPWVVFAGAALALIATSLVGVLLGRWLADRLSVKTLETVVGAILLAVSVSLLWDVVVG